MLLDCSIYLFTLWQWYIKFLIPYTKREVNQVCERYIKLVRGERKINAMGIIWSKKKEKGSNIFFPSLQKITKITNGMRGERPRKFEKEN